MNRDLPPATNDRRLWQIRWVRDLFGIFAALALLWLASQVQAVLIPVLVGLALAYAFNPMISDLARRGRTSRWVPTAMVVLVGAVLLVSLLAYLIPPLVDQTGQLVHNTPRYARRLTQAAWPFYKRLRGYLPGAGPTTEPAAERGGEAASATLPAETLSAPLAAETLPATLPAESIPGTLGPEVVVSREVAVTAIPSAGAGFDPSASRPAFGGGAAGLDLSTVGSLFMRSLNLGLSVLGTTVSVVSYLVLAGIITAFCFVVFSARFDRLTAWFGEFIPVTHRARALEIVGRMDRSVSAFIRGRIIQCVVLGTSLSLGWWLVGVPYWLLLGMVSGFLNLIPYASLIGLPIALLLCWVDSTTNASHVYSMVWDLVLPAVVYVVSQQTDNWVVEPLVQGKATNLDPLSVLLAVLIGGTLLGLLGMLIAIPVTACLKILAQELVLPRLREWARHPA